MRTKYHAVRDGESLEAFVKTSGPYPGRTVLYINDFEKSSTVGMTYKHFVIYLDRANYLDDTKLVAAGPQDHCQ